MLQKNLGKCRCRVKEQPLKTSTFCLGLHHRLQPYVCKMAWNNISLKTRIDKESIIGPSKKLLNDVTFYGRNIQKPFV